MSKKNAEKLPSERNRKFAFIETVGINPYLSLMSTKFEFLRNPSA
jgi:hypothetical protein